MALPDRRTVAGRKNWADAERALQALGWVRIPGHGWFVTEEDAMAIVQTLRWADRVTAPTEGANDAD